VAVGEPAAGSPPKKKSIYVLNWRSKENIENTQDASKPNKALAIIAKNCFISYY
jgi:hypothetical protein